VSLPRFPTGTAPQRPARRQCPCATTSASTISSAPAHQHSSSFSLSVLPSATPRITVSLEIARPKSRAEQAAESVPALRPRGSPPKRMASPNVSGASATSRDFRTRWSTERSWPRSRRWRSWVYLCLPEHADLLGIECPGASPLRVDHHVVDQGGEDGATAIEAQIRPHVPNVRGDIGQNAAARESP
jgi:hypothetical protein